MGHCHLTLNVVDYKPFITRWKISHLPLYLVSTNPCTLGIPLRSLSIPGKRTENVGEALISAGTWSGRQVTCRWGPVANAFEGPSGFLRCHLHGFSIRRPVVPWRRMNLTLPATRMLARAGDAPVLLWPVPFAVVVCEKGAPCPTSADPHTRKAIYVRYLWEDVLSYVSSRFPRIFTVWN